MSTKYTEVRELVSLVIQKIQGCIHLLSHPLNTFGKALKSLTPPLTNQLTHSIAILPDSDITVLSAKNVSSCLSGMSRMSSEHKEVRDLLNVLIPKFDKNSLLAPAEVSNAMRCLSNMTRFY